MNKSLNLEYPLDKNEIIIIIVSEGRDYKQEARNKKQQARSKKLRGSPYFLLCKQEARGKSSPDQAFVKFTIVQAKKHNFIVKMHKTQSLAYRRRTP
jgi:hypothetical protein